MPKILRAITTNAGVVAYYRRRLDAEIKAMHKACMRYVFAAYTAERFPELAQDAASFRRDVFAEFKAAMAQWLKRWNWLASWLAPRAVGKVNGTTTQSMAEAFKAAGYTVKFDKTRFLTDAAQAAIRDNVELITSIPEQYLARIEQIVLEGVSRGNDLAYMTEEIRHTYEVAAMHEASQEARDALRKAQRRAKWIARDQLDKACQAIQRERDKQLGITEGIWVHLPGQFTSRKTHIAMDGKRFKLDGPDAGLFDSDLGRNVVPGEAILCRCTYRRILPDLG